MGQSASASKPNIILMMTDDHGWGDTGYNGNKKIKTPNLDKMSEEGITFNRCYSASPVCSPTRASCLTGRNPYRMGVFHANKGILRPEEITIAEILKKEGYTTGHFGKWHLGTLTHTEKDSNRGRPGKMKFFNPPSKHGFDVNFSTEAKVPTWDPMKKPVNNAPNKGWHYIREGEPFAHFGTYYWNEKGEKITDNLDGDDSRVIMDRAIPFIEKGVKNNKPFLAVIWFHAPHLPVVAGPKYYEMYKNFDEHTINYYGCITAFDEEIGRLRAKLKELDVENNTMLWYCSDNGPENGTAGSTGGFRERKRSLHEGGVRVPGLLVWPDKIKKPFKTDFPCVTSDYLPTVMDVLGISSKSVPYELDGISLLPFIEGKMKQRPKPIDFFHSNQCSRSDNKYKLYRRNENYELYDIVKDPYEKENIAMSNPEVLVTMKQKNTKWISCCKESFEGKEYGTESYERMGQTWPIG